MAIGRTLTKKASTPSMPSGSGRRNRSDSSARRSISKSQISGPVELLLSTNMIAYSSPNIRSLNRTEPAPASPGASSSSSASSPEDSFPRHLFPEDPVPQIAVQAPPTPRMNKRFGNVLPPSPLPSPPPSLISPRASSSTTASSRSRSRSNSTNAPPSPHPFGVELAKVSEIAEEYHRLVRKEEHRMQKRGLKKYSYDDYMSCLGMGLDEVDETEVGGWI